MELEAFVKYQVGVSQQNAAGRIIWNGAAPEVLSPTICIDWISHAKYNSMITLSDGFIIVRLK